MSQSRELAGWLRELDLDQVVLSAGLTEEGGLLPVGGMALKVNAAWKQSRVGRLRYLVTAERQEGLEDGQPLGADELATITVRKAGTFSEVVAKLYQGAGPRSAVRRHEARQAEQFALLDRSVPWEGHYQPLPLLFRIPPERLPKTARTTSRSRTPRNRVWPGRTRTCAGGRRSCAANG
jgi:hypothetical protein